MNLNTVNLDCNEWSKSDWRDAYAGYCKHNQFGPMTKRQYYEFVNERHKRLRELSESPSKDFLDNHTRGWRNAVQWAKKRGCDMNGRLLVAGIAERRDADALAVAERAEDLATETMQRLDYLISKMKGKDCGTRDNDYSGHTRSTTA